MEGLVLFTITVIIVIFFIILYFVPVRLWITAMTNGARIELITLIGMRLLRVPPRLIVEQYISATRAGLDIDVRALQAHFLAGGNVAKVVDALISAGKAGIDLSFDRAAAFDLAGRDVLDAGTVEENGPDSSISENEQPGEAP